MKKRFLYLIGFLVVCGAISSIQVANAAIPSNWVSTSIKPWDGTTGLLSGTVYDKDTRYVYSPSEDNQWRWEYPDNWNVTSSSPNSRKDVFDYRWLDNSLSTSWCGSSFLLQAEINSTDSNNVQYLYWRNWVRYDAVNTEIDEFYLYIQNGFQQFSLVKVLGASNVNVTEFYSWDYDVIEFSIYTQFIEYVDSLGSTYCSSFLNVFARLNYNNSLVYQVFDTVDSYGLMSGLGAGSGAGFNYYYNVYAYGIYTDANRMGEAGLRNARFVFVPKSKVSYFISPGWDNPPYLIEYYHCPWVSEALALEGYNPPGEKEVTEVETLPYWSFYHWNITYSHSSIIEAGELNFTFNYIKANLELQKWYYNPAPLNPADWGDWTWLFNWLRDALCALINFLCLIGQLILWILVSVLEITVLALGILVILFLWNFLMYGICFIGAWLLWGLWVLINLIYIGLLAFFDWFFNVAIPALVYILLVAISVVLTAFIWLLSFGTANWADTYAAIFAFVQMIGDFFADLLGTIFGNLGAILLYATFYVVILGFGYLKFVYCKSRGFSNRAEQIHQAYDTYLLPVRIGQKIGAKIKELVTGWT